MLAVAPLVEIKEVNDFMVLAMDRPSREVPLFMQGKRSSNRVLSPGGELSDACVHIDQRGHMRCKRTQRC